MSGPASPSPRGGPSNLQLRVVSAVVLIALALAATWAGGVWFRALAVAIGAAMYYEWALMAAGRTSLRMRVGTGVLVAVPLGMILFGLDATMIFASIAAAALVTAGASLVLGERGALALALLYATLSAAALALLRGADAAGIAAILFLFAAVWATDIAAYFVGRAVGGPKLAPRISPGKTLSGAAGGAVAGVLAGVAVDLALGQPLGIALAAPLALALSVVSQAGDLFESAVKRRFGAKDSSSIIPGHGGVMDRVDALVAAAVALYLVGAAAGGVDLPAAALFGH